VAVEKSIGQRAKGMETGARSSKKLLKSKPGLISQGLALVKKQGVPKNRTIKPILNIQISEFIC